MVMCETVAEHEHPNEFDHPCCARRRGFHFEGIAHALTIARENVSVNEAVSIDLRNSPYLRGDGAASAYIGLHDVQGRTFRRWADRHQLPYAEIGHARIYRKSDIDRLWAQTAHNLHPLRLST